MITGADAIGLIHTGERGCGLVAFWYDSAAPMPTDTISAEDVEYLSGTRPAPGTNVVCQSCGAAIFPKYQRSLRAFRMEKLTNEE